MSLLEQSEPRNEKTRVTKLVIAGFLASLAMTAVTYLVGAAGYPAPDFAGIYGAILNGGTQPAAFSGWWWTGMLWHTINGTILFSLLYGYGMRQLVHSRRPLVDGLVWGVALWLIVEIIVKPIAGEGVFSRLMPSPVAESAITLIAWLIYGATLAKVSEAPLINDFRPEARRAA